MMLLLLLLVGFSEAMWVMEEKVNGCEEIEEEESRDWLRSWHYCMNLIKVKKKHKTSGMNQDARN